MLWLTSPFMKFYVRLRLLLPVETLHGFLLMDVIDKRSHKDIGKYMTVLLVWPARPFPSPVYSAEVCGRGERSSNSC